MVKATGYAEGKPLGIELTFIGKDTKGREALLRADAALAFSRMLSAAKASGIELPFNCAFRDHEWQEKLWNEYQRDAAKWALTPMATRGARPLRPSKPGFSRHEAGLAVDFSTLDASGKERPALAWLRGNGSDFGFANTVSAEPWHWEFSPTTAP
jgi:LAS superfamily LD-carboxypeptidase LdcB